MASITRPTIQIDLGASKWRIRFASNRLDGLVDARSRWLFGVLVGGALLASACTGVPGDDVADQPPQAAFSPCVSPDVFAVRPSVLALEQQVNIVDRLLLSGSGPADIECIYAPEGLVPPILTVEELDGIWLITSVRSDVPCSELPERVLRELHESTCA